MRRRWRTPPDRAGWALAAGAGACGVGTAFLGWGSGASAPGGLAIGLIGAMLSAGAIVGVGAPVWWLIGRRGPFAAGVTGAGVAALLTVAGLTRGFGLALPPGDEATLAAVWTSALVTGAVAGFVGGLVALAMWLVGYSSE